MATVEKSIEVNVPVSVAYNQWTQMEQFPLFMEGVEEVRQLDDKRMHWKASIAGKSEEWDAVITEQVPDEMIAWASTTGAENSGMVHFIPSAPTKTRITLVIGYDPEGMIETIGDKLGVVDRRVEGDLQRFKSFIEERGMETGAWRGHIHDAQVEGSASTM